MAHNSYRRFQLSFNHSLFILLVIAVAFGVSGSASAQGDNDPIRIVTTTTQATDLVTILAGDLVGVAIEITPLMGAGVDPHLYQPTESNIVAMNQAHVVIYSGLHLEGQFDAVFEALGERGVIIYRLSKAVEDAGYVISAVETAGGLNGADDPHFWFDPLNWQLTTEAVAALLAELDPDNADVYLENAAAYIEQLDLLYEWGLEGMSQVAEQQRYLVTSHDAFQYFGAAFGWRVNAIQGISTASEAGVGDIQSIVTFVIENDIPVMFVESSVPVNTVRAVQEAVSAAGGSVTIGVRGLYSDAMGEPDEFGGTYIGMIAHNVYTILQSYALQGVDITIPDWPEDLEPVPPQELLDMEM